MRSKSKLFKVVAATAVVLTAFIAASCDDDPVSPKPSGASDYHVYYFYAGGEIANRYIMPIYSTKTRTQTDSVVFKNLDPATFVFSPDGKYQVAVRAIGQGLEIIVENQLTKDTIARTPEVFVTDLPLISVDSRYMVSQGLYYSNGYYGGAAVYSLPTLSQLWIDTIEDIASVAFLGQTGRLIYTRTYVDSFFVTDFLSQPPVKQVYQAWPGPSSSSHYYPVRIAVDPVNDLLYTGGSYGTPTERIRIYNLNDFSLYQDLSPVPQGSSGAQFLLSHNGRYSYWAGWNRDTTSQSIFRYDAMNRLFEEFLSGSAIYYPEFRVRDMQLTPDGRTLCVVVAPPDVLPVLGNQSSQGLPRQPVLSATFLPGSLMMIDTDSRRVIAVFDRSTSGRAEFCRVYPLAQ